VIDVRDRAQFELGHIPGSMHVPIDRLQTGWELSDVRLPVAVLGEGDADADRAVGLLVDRGRDAITISGGAPAWRAAGQCLVTNRH
jgi:rhodanese-related sulfurtransferase